MFYLFSKNVQKKDRKKESRRSLRFESLEFRELLSVSTPEIVAPDFAAADSAYLDAPNAAQNAAKDIIGQKDSANTAAQTFTSLAAVSAEKLAPPKKARSGLTATPTTLEVRWDPPVATSTLKTDSIMEFDVVIRNAKTKSIVAQKTVNSSTLFHKFEGLNVKTRYEISITSRGGAETSSERATLKVTATTSAFPAVTAKASNLTLSSATLTVTDKDKIIPFVNGETVKTYTIQYVEKTSSTPNWSNAQSQSISAGTTVDSKKGTVAIEITGLKPGTQYFYRVLADYTDGTTPVQAEGRQATFKTVAFPATTISKTFFSMDSTNHLTIGLSGKVANITKLAAGTTVSFSLLVSTATTIDKTTGKLTDAKSVSVLLNPFTSPTDNAKGEFSMTAVDLETIIGVLDTNKVLASKTLSFQLEITFSGITTPSYSKTAKITMPAWHKV